ncbi:conserved Plasmodium protein, unknown function [Plasmodium gallinaceum]|uniref:Uncharacterized protein n=1 Tax=Plasmodium gallinaceum TaxID=5849 RepID=A0A1J1GVY9_PLAGA|nr:conserved Plasmodium protein, unknown function [Plasmodium gallinaceum]CRG96712.1 conserved Plasmodium protein, unknown function [Plasmodium gallinaceum]
MDPYKFNSWIRILISFCSSGVYILVSLMLPLFVAKFDFETRYGIFFIDPYNEKFLRWDEYESQICNKDEINPPNPKIPQHKSDLFCHSLSFFKKYFLIVFIVILINLIIVKSLLIYSHFREHPETFAVKHVKFCNKLIILIACLSLINSALIIIPAFLFNKKKEFGEKHYLHPGFYILLSDFLSHLVVIIFLQRDKTILKCVCELELLPWEKKQKLPVYNVDFNDTLISPNEITNYLQRIFHEDNINEEQLKNYFKTDNYEEIYYIIMNNIKIQNEMMNRY